MSNRYRKYFENINPDQSLVDDTLRKMQEELNSDKKAVVFDIKPVAAIAACVAVTASAIIFSPGLKNPEIPDHHDQAIENAAETTTQTTESSALPYAPSDTADNENITETISEQTAASETETESQKPVSSVSENEKTQKTENTPEAESTQKAENTVPAATKKPADSTSYAKPESTAKPSYSPVPTDKPTSRPTHDTPQATVPVLKPTEDPGKYPDVTHSAGQTMNPTSRPTTKPTSYPTMSPTAKPTSYPTMSPTVKPTSYPTMSPTAKPTSYPTMSPTMSPTKAPDKGDANSPGPYPTANPTMRPDDGNWWPPAQEPDTPTGPGMTPGTSGGVPDYSPDYIRKEVNGYDVRVNYADSFIKDFPDNRTESTYEYATEITGCDFLPRDLKNQITDGYSDKYDESFSNGFVFSIGYESSLLSNGRFINAGVSSAYSPYGYLPNYIGLPEHTYIDGKTITIATLQNTEDIYFCDVYSDIFHYRLTFKGYSLEETVRILEKL